MCTLRVCVLACPQEAVERESPSQSITSVGTSVASTVVPASSVAGPYFSDEGEEEATTHKSRSPTPGGGDSESWSVTGRTSPVGGEDSDTDSAGPPAFTPQPHSLRTPTPVDNFQSEAGLDSVSSVGEAASQDELQEGVCM